MDDGNVTWGCVGSLISERFVLTAGHCLNQWNKYEKVKVFEIHQLLIELTFCFYYRTVTVVRLGAINIAVEWSIGCPEDFNVEEIISHPLYDNNANDIALIRLDREVEFNPLQLPACLPDSSEMAMKLQAVGFGVTGLQYYSDSDVEEDVLVNIEMEVIPFENCNNTYAVDASNQFCVTPTSSKNASFVSSPKIRKS